MTDRLLKPFADAGRTIDKAAKEVSMAGDCGRRISPA
jgi:hypothetical protein